MLVLVLQALVLVFWFYMHFCEAVLVLVLLALVLVFWFHTLLWYAPRRGRSSHVSLPTIQAPLTLAERQKAE